MIFSFMDGENSLGKITILLIALKKFIVPFIVPEQFNYFAVAWDVGDLW